MSETTILIFDRDPHQREYFVSSFKEENIPVYEAESLKKLNSLLNPQQTQIILLDYASLVAEKREEIIRLFKSLKNNFAIVFNVPSDASKRIVFYELGALRVYDENTSIEEVYRNLKWWMNVQSIHLPKKEADIQGELTNVEFLKLLWGIAKNRKSGLLKIVTSRNNGHVFFKDGQIVEARVLNYTGLDAFLHISLWDNGYFTFNKDETSVYPQSIYLTLPGLMILAQNLKVDSAPILQEFKSDSSVIQAINLGDLALYDLKLNSEFLDFLSLPRELGEVLENPFYPNHETLKILSKLKHFGLLRVNEPIKSLIQTNDFFVEGVNVDRQTASELAWDVKKIDRFLQILNLKEGQQAKIVVISEDSEVLKHFLNTLAGSAEKVFFENNMYFVRLFIAEQLELILIGMRANHQLLRLLSVLSEQIHGLVFLLNAQKSMGREYYSYLINQVIVQYSVPAVCAVTYHDSEETIREIRKKFFLSVNMPWVGYKANNRQEMLDAVLQIAPVEPIEAEPSKQNEEKE